MSTIYGKPLMVVTAGEQISWPNGTEWTDNPVGISSTAHFSDIRYENGIWVAGGNDSRAPLYYSTDGKSWNRCTIPGNGNVTCITYSNGLWITSRLSSGLYYSTDGKVWTAVTWPITDYKPCRFIRNADGLWVAGSAGNGGLFYSTDGKTWTRSNITSGICHGLYKANGLWVSCVGTSGLYYSTDGKTWTKSSTSSGTFYGVYNANGIWVVGTANDKGAYYSTDGKTWTKSNITSGNFGCFNYGNGVFVMGGTGTKGLYYSLDGKTWTQSNITSGGALKPYYAAGIWVVLMNTDYLYYSFDGKTWIKSLLQLTNITDPNGTLSNGSYPVCNANGLWVAGKVPAGLPYSTTWEPV